MDRATLLQNAYAENPYPQYKGKWDNWLVAEVLKTQKSRAGNIIAAKGETILVDPNQEGEFVTTVCPNYYATPYMQVSLSRKVFRVVQ